MEAAEQLRGRDDRDRPTDVPVEPSMAARRRAAVELVRNHRTLLMASARRVSLCNDDAEDAVQRGLEILLAKAPTADARRLLPWARTVIRNEALAIRRTRERTLGWPTGSIPREEEDGDWVGSLPSDRRGPEDEVEEREFVARSREALALLKPQELKALTQLAAGMSYSEIGQTNGWTRTKVNRCLAEGREKLRSVVRESESGGRCGLIEPLISAAADGELEPDAAGEVRNHLAVCGGCRSLLREYRRIPAAVVGSAPLVGVFEAAGDGAPAQGLFSRAWERLDELSLQVWLRLNGLIGGGDGASAAVLGSGGARGIGTTAIAKVAAICVGTAGGAAACLGTGLVQIPGEREVAPEPVAVEQAAEVDREAPTNLPALVPADPPGGGPEPTEPEDQTPVEGAPAPDPVAAEFSPGSASASVAAPTPTIATAPAPPPAPAKQVPLGGSGEFGP